MYISRMNLRYIKYITLKRATNLVKVIFSYILSSFLRRPIVWGKPVFLFIEPTNRCNFQCPECPSGLGALTRKLGDMNFGEFQKIIDEISDYSIYIQIYLQGEPYLNKDLYQMLSYARTKRLYTVVSTNGSVVNERTVHRILENPPDKLIFSLDGLDEDFYQNYRIGGSFENADRGLNLLIKERNKLRQYVPKVALQFIVMKQNEHQISQVKKYGRERGVDKVLFKTMQVNSIEGANQFLPVTPRYRRYRINSGKLEIDGNLPNRCINLWHTSVITWDGKLVPCCFDKDAKFPLGSLNGKGISDFWKNTEYQEFRNKILTDRKGMSMCSNCTQGIKRKYFRA